MGLKNKRVLVTGGAGFIGKNLIKKLLKEYNCEVIVVDNFSTGRIEDIKKLDIKIIKADVSDRRFFEYIKDDVDFIFHLGAPSSVILFNEDPERRFRETVSGFINIMEFALRKGVEKVIYASSGSVYSKTSLPQSERSIPKPVNLYGIAKLTCEKIAEYYIDKVRSVGLRIFAGYGPGEEHKGRIASPITIFLNSIINDESPIVYGNGTQRRDFVYIDDIVEALIRSAEKKNVPPIINVGSGRSYTFNEVINLINKLLGKNIKPRYVPKPSKYLEATQADISLLKHSLGLEPIGLEEGLRRYLKILDLI